MNKRGICARWKGLLDPEIRLRDHGITEYQKMDGSYVKLRDWFPVYLEYLQNVMPIEEIESINFEVGGYHIRVAWQYNKKKWDWQT